MAIDWRWPPDRFSTFSAGVGDDDAEPAEHVPRGLVHAALVEKGQAAEAAARLAAEEEVAGDVDRVAERQVLIDHLDLLGARIGGRGEGDGACRRSRSCRRRG